MNRFQLNGFLSSRYINNSIFQTLFVRNQEMTRNKRWDRHSHKWTRNFRLEFFTSNQRILCFPGTLRFYDWWQTIFLLFYFTRCWTWKMFGLDFSFYYFISIFYECEFDTFDIGKEVEHFNFVANNWQWFQFGNCYFKTLYLLLRTKFVVNVTYIINNRCRHLDRTWLHYCPVGILIVDNVDNMTSDSWSFRSFLKSTNNLFVRNSFTGTVSMHTKF